ncbi:MAG TPA: hypothetical protein GXZ25_11450 [Peptococcaceae bacterium]|jgi:hypothetical protein|nr:hypothetical protein [Peptococcaceae bacterium]
MINALSENHDDELFKVTIIGIDRVTGEKHDILVRDSGGKLVVSDLINECDPKETLKRVNIALKEPQSTLDMIVKQKRDASKELRKVKNLEVAPEKISEKKAIIRDLEYVMQRLESMYSTHIEYVDAMKQVRKILRRRCKKWT